MSAPPRRDDPRRFLIVRTSALGDVVHALPVLTALRRRFPQARIGWVAEGAMAPLLAGHPDLDELFVVRLRDWRRRPFAAATRRELGAALGALRRFAPDVALDLMGNHKAGALAALSGARRRIGAARAGRREPSSALWISESVPPRGVHAVDRGLALLDALGLPPEPADFGGARLLPRAHLHSPPEPFFLLHPGAAWATKRYPPERWGEVARRLRAGSGFPTRIAVAPGEEQLAATVESAAGGAARAAAAPDLPSLVALTRAARLFLGGDTGPTHLAHALGTPVLMLMGPTLPERHGPYGAPERALRHPLLDIPPARVAERALELESPRQAAP